MRSRRTDDGTYPEVEEAQAKNAERAAASGEVTMEDVTGKPRPKGDLEAALRFVEAEMLASPMRMGAKDTGPAVMHYMVIREVLQAVIAVST